jgi:hypothetical protein
MEFNVVSDAKEHSTFKFKIALYAIDTWLSTILTLGISILSKGHIQFLLLPAQSRNHLHSQAYSVICVYLHVFAEFLIPRTHGTHLPIIMRESEDK